MEMKPVKLMTRGAAFVRVSTDGQEERGASLEAQLDRINATAERHGIKIFARYGGSEHATPGHEHSEFERMIADAVAGRIGAIFVADAQRWSRDVVASEQAIRSLKKHQIKLFIGANEYDLRSSATQLGLTLLTKSSENETNARLDSSAFGRISLAARGFVSSGHPPFGRYVEARLIGTTRVWDTNPDGTAKWQVDLKKKRQVEKAAKLYLSGKTWDEVGQALGIKGNTIRRRVYASDGKWQQEFSMRENRAEDFAKIRFYERLKFNGNHVIVTIPIPQLLDDITLSEVRAKASMHYADRKADNKQVLGGYIKCAICGGSLSTHFHEPLNAVYIGHDVNRQAECPGSLGRYESLERSVLRKFHDLLRNTEQLEACVKEALAAEISRAPELESQLKEAIAARADLIREHDDTFKKLKAFNLVDGGTTKLKFQVDLNRLDAQIKAADECIDELKGQIKVTHLPPDFSARLEFTLFCLRGFDTNNRWLWTWPKSQQREIFKFLFGEKTRRPHINSKKPDLKTGIYIKRGIDQQSGKPTLEWFANGWFPQVSDAVWLDPKVTSYFRPKKGVGQLDRKRLVQLISRLDFEQFRFARLAFNASKLEGIPGKSSSARCITTRVR